jgi:hypothetical protein
MLYLDPFQHDLPLQLIVVLLRLSGKPFWYLLLILVPDGEVDLDLSIDDLLPGFLDNGFSSPLPLADF